MAELIESLFGLRQKRHEDEFFQIFSKKKKELFSNSVSAKQNSLIYCRAQIASLAFTRNQAHLNAEI